MKNEKKVLNMISRIKLNHLQNLIIRFSRKIDEHEIHTY